MAVAGGDIGGARQRSVAPGCARQRTAAPDGGSGARGRRPGGRIGCAVELQHGAGVMMVVVVVVVVETMEKVGNAEQ